jgi:putative membrane protein
LPCQTPPIVRRRSTGEEKIMTMKLVLGAAVAAALALGGSSAFAQSNTTQGKASDASQTFIKEAIQGNLAEIEMGKLAQKNGASESVRAFGKMLEQDHSVAKQKAQGVAQTLKVTPPTSPSEEQQADHDKLAKLKGAEFDSAFIKAMVADHEQDIRNYQAEAQRKDAAANYARETLPTLKKHLARAQSLNGAATTGSR